MRKRAVRRVPGFAVRILFLGASAMLRGVEHALPPDTPNVGPPLDGLDRLGRPPGRTELSGMGNHWLHAQGVARKAQVVSEALEGNARDHLVAAAHLHDIAYAPALQITGLHQLDGAMYLRSLGHEWLAGLSRITRRHGSSWD
jgi:hypothetical protein